MATFLQPQQTTDSFSDAATAMLLLVKGQLKGGGTYWAYIAIAAGMLSAFNSAKSNGRMFDLEEYGTILEWGSGENPPAQTHAQMQAMYGASNVEEAAIMQKMKSYVEFN
jgi:hypothetical protein